MAESQPPSSSSPGGDGQPPRKRKRRRRRGKKPDSQTLGAAPDTTGAGNADDTREDSSGGADEAGDDTRADASPRSEAALKDAGGPRDQPPRPAATQGAGAGYSNTRGNPAGDRNPNNRGPRDRGGPPSANAPRPRFENQRQPRDSSGASGGGGGGGSTSGGGRKPPAQAPQQDDDGGRGGKKRRKPRTKQCVHCLTPCTTIHRVQLDYRKQWVFICDICWPSRCVGNPHYHYGGMWVSGRIVKPESQLRDEARARGGHHGNGHSPYPRPAPVPAAGAGGDPPRHDRPDHAAQAVLDPGSDSKGEVDHHDGDDSGSGDGGA